MALAKPSEEVLTAHRGESGVQQQDVGLCPGDEAQQIVGRPRVADDLEIRRAGEDDLQARAQDLVIGNDDPDRSNAWSLGLLNDRRCRHGPNIAAGTNRCQMTLSCDAIEGHLWYNRRVDSRIGASLRAARIRAGWTREALAYHAGVSWSAIAQIESGRRKDIRLSSLSALADALGVSVDHLIGSAAAAEAPNLFEHQALVYGSDEEFIAATIPFLDEGLEHDDRLLAVTTEARADLLRDVLGERSAHIEFADWADWYRSPTDALRRYAAYVKQQVASGAVWIRVLAEAGWGDVTDTELAVWTRYESLVNLAFASSPATILCTYDESALPAHAVADAHTTHPEIVCGHEATASPGYRTPEDLLLQAR
jgi:transcriptional regulator with XRE-family HTH domain